MTSKMLRCLASPFSDQVRNMKRFIKTRRNAREVYRDKERSNSLPHIGSTAVT